MRYWRKPLDIDQVMQTIMERLNKIFSFTHTAILFLDEEQQRLDLDRMGGEMPAELREKLASLYLPLSEKNSVFVESAVKQRPVYQKDVAVETRAETGVSAFL